LTDLKAIPEDLENYVLNLYFFSGKELFSRKKRRQSCRKRALHSSKKVNYIPIVQSPDGKVKAEVRVLCVWKKRDAVPTLLCNLVRLSRGEMIGVKFNKDRDWVGGTIGLFVTDASLLIFVVFFVSSTFFYSFKDFDCDQSIHFILFSRIIFFPSFQILNSLLLHF
jgi:hypothetical protein